VVGLALLHLVDVETWNIVEGVVAEAFRRVLRPQPCVEGPVVVVVVVVVVVAAAFLDSTAAEALQLQDETGSSHQVR
jgi:hypothetical protein